MAAKKYLRIGFCLAAVALLGGATLRAGFAEDAPKERSDGKAANSTAAPSTATDAAVKGTGAPAAGKTLDDIDTRISVQPHGNGARPQDAARPKAKIVSPSLGNLRRRAFAPRQYHVMRNAIGVAVPEREAVVRHGVEHPAVLPVAHPIPGAGGLAAGASKPKAEIHIDRLVPHPAPLNNVTALNRATINGSNAIRHGSALSGIGGPARTTIGLNGTAIWRKR